MRGYFAVGVVLISGVALGQVTKSGNGYLFRTRYTPGVTQNFQLTVSQGGADPVVVTIPLRQTTTGVKNGIASVSATLGPMKMNGNALANSTQSVNFKVDGQGRVTSGQAASGTVQQFPAKPIRIGDTWSATYPLAQMQMGVQGNARSTMKFVRMTTFNGKPAAEISVSVNSDGSARLSGTGTMLISVADGAPLLQKMNLRYRTTGQNNLPVESGNLSMKLVRV